MARLRRAILFECPQHHTPPKPETNSPPHVCFLQTEENRGNTMPVLSKFNGIVIRMLVDRTFGTRLHAFYGNTELVMGLNPVRVIQGDVPAWVQSQALHWARQYETRAKAEGFILLQPTPAKPSHHAHCFR
jgi:hypothetical protein